MEQFIRHFIHSILKSNALTNPASPQNGNYVNDVYYNELVYINGGWSWKNVKRTSTSNLNDVIIIVLESPHIDEFSANGTGKYPLFNDVRFKNVFPILINNAINSGLIALNRAITYSVYLMNAIQVQCSLGYPTEYYRDYVFMYYWSKLKTNFETRLHNMMCSKNVVSVINLCTLGSHERCSLVYNHHTQKYEYMCKKFGKKFIQKCKFNTNGKYTLRKIVQESIDSNTTNSTVLLLGNHPSSLCFNKPLKSR